MIMEVNLLHASHEERLLVSLLLKYFFLHWSSLLCWLRARALELAATRHSCGQCDEVSTAIRRTVVHQLPCAALGMMMGWPASEILCNSVSRCDSAV